MTPEERVTTHDADVAAVLAEAPCIRVANWTPSAEKALNSCRYSKTFRHPECMLAALVAAGYAVVKLPEGVAVEHGARLRLQWLSGDMPLYAIEATP